MDSRTPIRHGEVLLLPVDSPPAGAVRRVRKCIVGHSESGHHHVIESATRFSEIVTADGGVYVDLDAPAVLLHRTTLNRHRDLPVTTGVWRVLRKTEFDVSRLSASAPDRPVRPRPIADADFHDEGWAQRTARPVSD